MISISNDFLKITVREQGCELIEIKSVKSQKDFIHKGDEKFWTYSTPILFPIVGRNKDDLFKINGKEYPISKHGFLRDSKFEIEKISDTEIKGTLKHSDNTLKSFPYKFTLTIIHKLEENKVTTSVNIANENDVTMYFGLGGHPALKCPINDSLDFQDYYIEFEEKERAEYSKIDLVSGFFTGEKELFLNNENKINLNYDLFLNDAVTFTDLKSKKAILKSDKLQEKIIFEFSDFPYIAFWTKKDAPFICFEPWFSHGDFINFEEEHNKKEGIIELEQKKVFSCSYSYIISE